MELHLSPIPDTSLKFNGLLSAHSASLINPRRVHFLLLWTMWMSLPINYYLWQSITYFWDQMLKSIVLVVTKIMGCVTAKTITVEHAQHTQILRAWCAFLVTKKYITCKPTVTLVVLIMWNEKQKLERAWNHSSMCIHHFLSAFIMVLIRISHI